MLSRTFFFIQLFNTQTILFQVVKTNQVLLHFYHTENMQGKLTQPCNSYNKAMLLTCEIHDNFVMNKLWLVIIDVSNIDGKVKIIGKWSWCSLVICLNSYLLRK